jgi:single-stranded-DNA-specific exonuclease
LRCPDPLAVRQIVVRNGLPEVVARLLAVRGHVGGEATSAHLDASLHTLHDPAQLPGMVAATARIARAVERGETILVHGDYDVDGVTGTALLMRLLELIGARAVWHIPNRLTDGYSFGAHSVARALEVGAKVVISVDNGTSAGETIARLLEHGIDTIVTDHHEPPLGELPSALAIVNPKLAGSRYPFRELCGAGVAFKLAWGVAQELSGARKVREDLRQFLVDAMAYVAIATVCDVVPLRDENRVLARRGLAALESTQNIGLRALLASSGLTGERLYAEDVGFKIGPRINAAGRLGSAARAVELLLAKDTTAARRLASELEALNLERRRIEASLLAQALEQAERFSDPARYPVLVLAGQGWHSGVVGIVAARIVQRYSRPALVIGLDGEVGRGSARSVPGFSVLDAMHGARDHMLRYGGHEQAAGCEVRADAIERLRETICERAREMLGRERHAESPLWIDSELPLPHMTDELMKHFDRLEPFGAENEKPVLLSSDVRLAEPARIVGEDRTHLMLRVRHGERVLKAMAFGMANRAHELSLGTALHVVYTPRWNSFRGETNLELALHDFCVGPRPALG